MRLMVSILVLILLALAYQFGRAIPFVEQWPLFEALRTTAAIIFAVVGAWLAIVYPERLKLSFRRDDPTPSLANGGIGQLLSPAVHSTAILSIVLIVGVTAPVLKRIAVLHVYSVEMRGLSYTLLVFLTLWQLWTVILTLVPADRVKDHADAQDSFNSTVSSYKALGHKVDPKRSPPEQH